MKRDPSWALDLLDALLRQVPVVRSVVPGHREAPPAVGVEAVEVELNNGDRDVWLMVRRSRPLRPKQAQLLALELEQLGPKHGGDYAVVVAPYVSPRSAEILARSGIGFVDASGNCRLSSRSLYVERTGFPNAMVEKARLRSLFSARAERVLRAVLNPEHQGRRWRIRTLAEAAYPGVSVGQAHKVVKLLEDEAYLRREADGVVLTEPTRLLEEWASRYRFGRNRAERYYSPLSQDELHRRFADVGGYDAAQGNGGLLASFSAADILAPAVRQHRFFVYWAGTRELLKERLELKPVTSGENVVVYEPYDEGVFYRPSPVEAAVTCPVQTYLDLRASTARGEEAAQAVFERWLKGAFANGS